MPYSQDTRRNASDGGRDSDTLCDMEWIVGLIDACASKPNRPKIYKKRTVEAAR